MAPRKKRTHKMPAEGDRLMYEPDDTTRWPPHEKSNWAARALEDLGWLVLPDGTSSARWFVLRLWLARPLFWLADRFR